MARALVLNPRAAPARSHPAALSVELLVAAKALPAGPAAERVAELAELAGQLQAVRPDLLGDDETRIAFWTNLYNALLLHRLRTRPISGSILWRLRMFDRVAYRVGGLDYPLSLIENGLLRVNRRAPLRARRPLRGGDRRLVAIPSRLDPRIHFALNCGARSCPPIRVYEPEALERQLELATRSYLEAETGVDPGRRRVRLPGLIRVYRADFGGRRRRLEFVAARVGALAALLDDGGPAPRVSYGRFDWTATEQAG